MKNEQGVTLFYDLWDAGEHGEKRGPADVLRSLGVAWKGWEGQPFSDQIKLTGCTSVPKLLPDFIRCPT